MYRTPPNTQPLHLAFPARSQEAVHQFFVRALKAGAKFHGEPRTRDDSTSNKDSTYFSAAVLDFDGNSIEAVHRSSSSSSPSSSAGAGPAKSEVSVSPRGGGLLLENGGAGAGAGSVVSKASGAGGSVKPGSSSIVSGASRGTGGTGSYYAAPKSEAAVSKSGSSAAPAPRGSGGAPGPTTYIVPSAPQKAQPQPQTGEDGKTAKTIVGTLVGAAAGAAIAYAMTKGEGESEEDASGDGRGYPQLVASQSQSQLQGPVHPQGEYRVIEAPAQSTTYSTPRPQLARSTTSKSKNPRASTVYDGSGGGEGAEFYYVNGDDGQYYRRASEGSVAYYPSSELPLRALEYHHQPEAEVEPCNPPTLISSFTERSRRSASAAGGSDRNLKGGSVYSSSTIKPPKSTASSRKEQPDSQSQFQSQTGRSAAASSRKDQPDTQSQTGKSAASTKTAKTKSSTQTARNVPLPETSTPTASAASSKRSYRTTKSGASARNVPLPESVVGGSSAGYSHSHSKAGASGFSRRSSRFDEPVRPADSVSQV